MTDPKIKYKKIREGSIIGRYVTLEKLYGFLKKTNPKFSVRTIGKSVLKKDIQMVTLGSGSKKILMWSQMHGNESTTTKAALDLINFFDNDSESAKIILDHCTIKIIPILNPDGAAAYTRVNANEVDLNRDAQDLSQPESQVLRSVYDDFLPDYCFNLHDQRTIFNVGDSPKPATVSFLAPAHDVERSISKTREISMQLISAMAQRLEKLIPGQIGRYDDTFNPNCVGDAFQMMGSPTMLFEAGHFPGDYQRERTREYIFWALMEAVQVIAEDVIYKYDQRKYFDIPENNKLFLDVIVNNIGTLNRTYEKSECVGILFNETLKDEKILFEPKIEKIGDLKGYFAHKVFNCLEINDLDSVKTMPLLAEILERSKIHHA